MSIALYIPFFVQFVVITVDEFYFHWRRGLPRWERLGHPLDTLTVIAALAYPLIFPFSRTHLACYSALAAFSAFFVTKDEFVHKECCSAHEQWLHALLFLNHPLVLIAVAFLWVKGASLFLVTQLVAGLLFCFYQTIYWNFIWKQG